MNGLLPTYCATNRIHKESVCKPMKWKLTGLVGQLIYSMKLQVKRLLHTCLWLYFPAAVMFMQPFPKALNCSAMSFCCLNSDYLLG